MKKHKTRLDYNRNILEMLSKYCETHPDLRFHQTLFALELDNKYKDLFYEESKDTLEKLKEKFK